MNPAESFIGIDGCRGGWAVAILRGNQLSFSIEKTFFDCKKFTQSSKLTFVDMPIGLTNAVWGRICEAEARKDIPTNYKSSIFTCPCLSAVYSETFEDANQAQRKITGKGLSIQAWNITKKIKEIDLLMKAKKMSFTNIYESHPEICFSLLNNGVYLSKKKTKEGIRERIELLERHSPIQDILDSTLTGTKRSTVMIDDLLDAACLAVSAQKAFRNNLCFYPKDKTQLNEEGLNIQIAKPCYCTKTARS